MSRRRGAGFVVAAFLSVSMLGLLGLGPASAGGSGPDAFIYLSSTTSGSVAGVVFEDEDIVRYDTVADTWELVFDGSDVLPAAADVNAFALNDDGSMLLSFQANVTIVGLGTVDDSDVVLFTPTSTGDLTAGSFSLALDGSTVGLTTSNEEITALVGPEDAGAELVVSTLGGFNVPKAGGGNLTGVDEDLIGLNAGAWDLRFDGSDVALATEDLWGAWIDPDTGVVYGASLNAFSVPGLTGDGDDVFAFTGVTGAATSGTFATVFDGDAHGFGGEQIDALHLELQQPPPPGDADLSITKTDAVDPVLPGDLITYTVTVSNAGPDAAENVVVTDTLPAGVTLVDTNGCAQDPAAMTCSLGSIAANGSADYTITVQVDAGTAGVLSNSATVAAGTADPDPNNNTAAEETLVGSTPVAVDDGPATNSMVGDPYHTATNAALAAPSGALTGNDTVGDPAAMIASFGGGDLGGIVSDNAAGGSVAVGDGSISIGPDGGFSFVPPTGFDGVFSVDYRLANVLGDSDATLSIFVGERLAVEGGDLIYLSSTSFGTVDGISFDDEDVLVFDNELDTWEMYFDGTDVLPAGADLNAFYIEDDGNLLMSFQNPVTIAGLGTIDDSDIVRFNPTTLGESTTGFFTLVLDGTGFGLTTNAEEISALTAYDGDHVVSTAGSFNVPLTAGGNQLGRDEDLIVNTGPGTWTLLFDGSDVGLAAEDIAGVSYDADTQAIYATSFNGYNVPGLSGDNNDVIVFSGTTGQNTAGTFSTFFDGDNHRFGDEQLDALHIVLNRNEAPTANPDRAVTDENTPITIGPDYTTSIAIPGAAKPEKVGVDPRNGNIVVAENLFGTTEVRVRTYDPVNRRVVHTFTTPFTGIAMGLDVDPATGDVILITRGPNRVMVLDPTLTTVLHTIDPGTTPTSVALNPFTDEIIVGASDFTRIYTSDLTSFTTIEHAGLVSGGVDVSERNRQIVSVLWDNQGNHAPGEFVLWEFDGSQYTSFVADQTDFATDLAIDQATGDVAVTNNTHNRGSLLVFDEYGSVLVTDDSGVQNASGVAFDPMTGNLLVAEEQGLVLDRSSLDLLDTFLPQPGRALAVAPGDEDIAIGKENLAITTDTFNLFDPTGRARQVMFEESVADLAIDPTTDRIAVLAGPTLASRRVDIYDPTGTTVLHTTTVSGATAIAFHPDTGELGVAPVSGQFQLWDPTLTTINNSFPATVHRGLGIQPGTGNVVFGLGTEAVIFDHSGTEIGRFPLGQFGIRHDLAVDPVDGRILLAGSDQNVDMWDATGTVLLQTFDAGVSSEFKSAAFGGTGNIYLGNSATGDLDVLVRGLLANDADPDGDALTVSSFDATSANGAAVTVNPDGSFTYDPTGVTAIVALGPGDTLADTFTYTIDDGNGETSTAIATVFVAGVNDAPVLGSPTAVAVNENVAAVADYNASDDSDSEGSGLTYSLVGRVDDANFSIDPATGALAFLAPPDFEAPGDADGNNVYEIVVKVVDSDGSYQAVPVTVTVLDVTDTATITIVQDTRPDASNDFSFTGDLGVFTLDDDAAAPNNTGNNTFSNTFEATLLDPGVYQVTQGSVSPFVVTDLDCTGGSTSVDLGTRTATITVAAGDAVTCTFVTEPQSDVSVSLSDSPDPVEAGTVLSYTFGFSSGTFQVSNPVLTLELPDGVTFIGTGFLDSFCSEATPGVVTCDGFNGLWSALTDIFRVTVDAGTVGPLTATGSVSFTGVFDPNLSNNSVTVSTTVTPPDLPPTLVSSTPPEGGIAEPDDDLVLTFSEPVTLVESAGPAITIVCDTGGSFNLLVTGGPTEFTASPSPDLQPGANCTVTALASRVLDQDGTPDQLTSDAIFSFQVTPPSADLSVELVDFGDPVAAGGDFDYVLRVSNLGPDEATGVVATLLLPTGTSLPFGVAGCLQGVPGVVTCTFGTVAANSTGQLFVTPVVVDAGASGTVTATLSVTGNEADPDLGNNSVTEDTEVNAS